MARDGIVFNVKVIDERLPGVSINGTHLCFEDEKYTYKCVFLCTSICGHPCVRSYASCTIVISGRLLFNTNVVGESLPGVLKGAH